MSESSVMLNDGEYLWLFCFQCGSGHLHRSWHGRWRCPNCHALRDAPVEKVEKEEAAMGEAIEERVTIPEELKAKVDDLLAELDRMEKDPELRKRAEEFHRRISALSSEDLMRPFTI